jgi:CRISPR-associated exonuclease Cas4
MNDIKISGSIIQSYMICPRQSWLMTRNLSGDQHNEFLDIGRLISEETYKRDRKEIMIGGNKIDVIRKDQNSVLLIETKKSSRAEEAGEMQLLFYMYNLRHKIEHLRGEIRYPKEKKVVELELTEEKIKEIEGIIERLNEIGQRPLPPEKKWIGYCKTCSYLEFCWA